MENELKQLESAGYSFEATEKPTTDPAATVSNYFVITIRYHGDTLGTRTEITREGAMKRAVLFAQKHHAGEDIRTLMV